MTIEEIRIRAIDVVAKVRGFAPEEIHTDSTFEELDLDSLSRIEVLVGLEREFGMESSAEEDEEDLLSRVLSVEDSSRLVEKNLAAA